jgi:ABC-type dipeptide/oligopeptide/nickel transport system permease subunit
VPNDVDQETPVPVKSNKPRIDWAKLFWMLRKSPLTMIGGVIMFLMLALMVTSPWIVPHDPNALDLTARLQAPSAHTGLVPTKWDAICSAACWWAASSPSPPGWRWW